MRALHLISYTCLITIVIRFLNPGGKIEVMDIIYPPQSDDGTLSEESPLYKWATLLVQTFTNMRSPLDSALRYKEQLEAAGFINVTVVKRKWPMNRWPKAQKYKQIGKTPRTRFGYPNAQSNFAV